MFLNLLKHVISIFTNKKAKGKLGENLDDCAQGHLRKQAIEAAFTLRSVWHQSFSYSMLHVAKIICSSFSLHLHDFC